MFRKLKRKTRKLLMAAVKPFPRARRLSRAAIRARRVRLYEKLAAESEIDEKLIIFESFHGRNYSDNPRAIFEKMCEMPEFNGYKFVWAFKKVAKFNRYDFPEIAEMRRHSALENSNVEIVEYGSRRYREVYASAGVWVSNSRIPDYIYRKDDQKYIQTWHGTPLKRLGYDIKSGNNALNTMRDMREKYDSDAMRYTAMVSPSPYVSEIYKSAFNLDNWHRNNIVYETGYPRNDLLVNFSEDDAPGRGEIEAPNRPATYCPYALAKNHIPIINPCNLCVASFVISESPIGESASSPKVRPCRIGRGYRPTKD